MLSKIFTQPRRLYPALCRLNYRPFSNMNKGPNQGEKVTDKGSDDKAYDLMNADPVLIFVFLLSFLELKRN